MFQPKGWHSRGYLPHFDSPETIQFVTFRLADSLPRAVIESLRLRGQSLQAFDQNLDVGLGACWLREPKIASLVEGALLYADGERYRLLAWCLMPEHVHVVEIRRNTSLSAVLKSWKSFTARRANAELGRTGSFWQNPVKAKLTQTPADWPWSSARFRV
jgi:hypothetical protein